MKTTMNTGPGRFYRSRPKAMIAGLAGALVFAASLFTGGGKAQAAAPDAGSSVGNIATASYLDGGGTSRTANSLPVITTVEQVGSLTLTATQTLPASPGQPVTFVHNLVNTGNGTDSFNLVTAQLGTDDFNFTSIQIFLDADKNGVADGAAITSVDNLGRDADVNILVIATVPGSAVDGDQGQLTITATSQATGTATDTNTDTADVTGAANVTVSKTVVGADDGAPGDGPFTFRFTYENIGIGAAQTLTFTDTINAELEYVDDSGRWSVTGATVLRACLKIQFYNIAAHEA